MEINSLYQKLLNPSDDLLSDIAKLDGNILILGVGGKMGPGLARLAKQAVEATGIQKEVIGVARFSEPGLQQELELQVIRTYAADLLHDHQLQHLPPAHNVLFLAGTKFGTTGKEAFAWVMNSYLPGRVAKKFWDPRLVVFSTGNLYPLMPV